MNSEDIKNAIIVAGIFLGVGYLRKIINPDIFESETLEAEINPENLTYSNSWYVEQADALENALWYWWIVEDEAAVVNIMKLAETKDDVLKLALVYRSRCQPLQPIGCTPERLVQSIQSFLSQDEIDEINSDYAEKGINLIFVST